MIYLNGKKVIFGKFPNNESYLPIEHLEVKALNTIKWAYQNDKEFFQIAMLKDHLDAQLTKSRINIFYMPHSRMDRVNFNYAFSLKTTTNLINNMDFVSVMVCEPHSDVTMGMLDRVFKEDFCIEALQKVGEMGNIDSLFFPDAGAMKRYSISKNCPYGVGNKVRDFETGNILSYTISGNVGKNVLIVDDMCSRGGTFIEASIELKKNGAEKVSLLVSYLENNVFTGDVFDHLEKIYCSSNNLLNIDHGQVVKICV
jgi:ribose-phosphate pyrophosphokinase